MSNDKMHNAVVGEIAATLKHNETDFKGFRDFQDKINKRYTVVERERLIEERSNNLKKWDNSVPSRWRGASLTKIQTPAAKSALKIIKETGKGSFFINGVAGSGKTYLAYAIIRKCIGSGWATFSEVKIISEETLLGYAYTGFEGKAKFEKLFNPQYKVYLLDNIGGRENYDVNREVPLLERLIDHFYTNSIPVIFASNDSASRFAEVLGESGKAKFRDLVSRRVITLSGDNQNVSENVKKTGNDENDKLNAFGS